MPMTSAAVAQRPRGAVEAAVIDVSGCILAMMTTTTPGSNEKRAVAAPDGRESLEHTTTQKKKSSNQPKIASLTGSVFDNEQVPIPWSSRQVTVLFDIVQYVVGVPTNLQNRTQNLLLLLVIRVLTLVVKEYRYKLLTVRRSDARRTYGITDLLKFACA
jgi:hypothetical protein